MFLLNSLKFFSLHFTINRKNKALCQKKSRIYQTCNTQVRPKILYSWIQLCYTVKSSIQTVQANSLISRRTGRYLQTKSKWLIYNKQRQKIHGKSRLLLNVLKKIHNATLFIPQPCPKESENFRDVQCASYNGRDIFINGERAKWKSYSRGNCHKCNNRSTF